MVHLQLIVLGKSHNKIPSHDIVRAEILMDNHTTYVIYTARNTPGGIGQMSPAKRAAGAKLAHHACQTLSPIAWAKSASRTRNSQDVNFF